MKTSLIPLVLSLATALAAGAHQIPFNFKDPKGVNTVTFTLDAPLEAISGSANGVSGEVHFDPANPAATSGKLIVDTASLHVPNPTMKQHLHGKDWMDVTSHPTLSFETDSLSKVKTTENVTTAEVTGRLTIKGVSKIVTVPVRITYLKDRLKDRTNGQMQGDLLVLSASFPILRSDFGINPKAPTDKVSDEIMLGLSVAGYAPKRP
jgi:polyisoprenoid-binding protein YceI